MNKLGRVLCILLALFLPSALFASAHSLSNDEEGGRAVAGVATSGEYASLFANPAALTGCEEGFRFALSWKDQAGPAMRDFFLSPATGSSLSFRGANVALTIEIINELEERKETAGGLSFKAVKWTHLQLDWAFTFHKLSCGFSFKATMEQTRTPLSLSAGRLFIDYLAETMVGEYDSPSGSTAFSTGFGLLLDYDWLKIGAVSSRFASVTPSGAISFSFADFYRSFGFGMTLSTPKFSKEGQLHLCRVSLSGELLNIGDSDNSRGNIGLSFRFQFLPDYQLVLRSGVTEPKGGNILSTNWSRGEQTFGIGVTLSSFRFDAFLSYPLSLYAEGGPVDVPFTLIVSFCK